MSKTLFDSVHLPDSPFDQVMRMVASKLRASDFVQQEFPGGVKLHTLPTTPGELDFQGNQVILSPVAFEQAGESTRSTYAAGEVLFSFHWQGFDPLPATEEGKTVASLVSWLASICAGSEIRLKCGNATPQITGLSSRELDRGSVIVEVRIRFGLNIFYYKTTPGA